MLKKTAIIAACLAAALQSLLGQTTTVSFDSGTLLMFNENTAAMTPLSGGSAVDGNGTVLQLGYYSGATAGNNFAGTWIPLSGMGSANTAVIPGGAGVNPTGETYNQTSIGDLTLNGAGNGSFALTLNFTLTDPLSNNNLPAMAGIPLSLRFYNGTTIANSSFFNTVSSDLWAWKVPGTPPVNVTISFNDTGLVWESIVVNGQPLGTAFHTTIAIPEPSTYALLGMGAFALMLGFHRRRQVIA